MDDSADVRDLGVRLRQLRLKKGWILGRLATETGLSEAYLSRVETGARTPSLGTILAVTRALDVRVGQVFDQPEPSPTHFVCRGDDRAGEIVGGQAVGLSSSEAWSTMEVVRLTLAAGHPGLASRHHGEEFVFVRSGTVKVTLDDARIDLEAGDSIHFDASIEHVLAAGGEPAEVLLVAAAGGAVAHAGLFHSY